MKLWLISQSEQNDYDTYDSAVVAAETEQVARNIHPSGYQEDWKTSWGRSWASIPENVKVEYLGEGSGEERIICASFNAG